MPSDHAPQSLDVASFAAAAGHLQGCCGLSSYPRLMQDCLLTGENAGQHVQVRWQARGLRLPLPEAGTLPALRLQVQADLPLSCRLCLDGVLTPVTLDRCFAFAASEEAAAHLDEQAEDVDVLALTPHFDLHALIEDELLMALPLAPRHEEGACPARVPMSAQSEGFEAAARRPNPFAALSAIGKGGLTNDKKA